MSLFYDADDPLRSCRSLIDQMKEQRSSFESFYCDVKKYIVPDRGRCLDNDDASSVNDGRRKDSCIINGAATKALEVMASGFHGGLTNKSREWFSIAPSNGVNSDVSGAQSAYANLVKSTLMQIFDRSNLYNALHDFYTELGAFGTAAFAILPHPDKVMYFRNYTCGSYYAASNNRMEIDIFASFEYYTARQMMQEYGMENLSLQVRNALENNRSGTRFKVWSIVFKDPKQYNIKTPSGMTAAELHFEDSANRSDGAKGFLAVRYYRSFPVVCVRWSTVGADTYGTSPTRGIIGSVKMLQQMEKDKLQGIAAAARPPVQSTGEVYRNGINTAPGGVTIVSNMENAVRPLYQVQPDIASLANNIREVENSIQRGYYNDLFLMLQQRDMVNQSQMTKAEVDSRDWERMVSLGPVLERIHYEGLNPLISRAIQIIYYAGLIPDAPEELSGNPLKIEYVSVLSQAQKAVAVKTLESMCQFVSQMAAVKPEMIQTLKSYSLARRYAVDIGFPLELMPEEEEFNNMMAQQKQQNMMMQQSEMAGNMAQAAKTAGEVNSGSLSDLVSQLTGRTGGAVL